MRWMLVVIAHIELERKGLAAHRFDLSHECREIFALAAGDDEIGARPRQGAPEILAKSAARAGDESGLPAQVEEVLAHEASSPTELIGRSQHDLHQVGLAAMQAFEPCGPSSSGATAVMSGLTRIAPVRISSMASGYSPDEAARALQPDLPADHLLQRQLNFGRDVADQRHRPALADAVDRSRRPFRRGRQPRRRHRRRCRRVSRSTSASIAAPDASMVSSAPISRASFSRVASISATKTREQPAARAACRVSRPIMPAPITSAVSPPLSSADRTACSADRNGFQHGRFGEAQLVRQPVDDALGHGDILGESSVRGGSRRRRRPPPGGCRRG